MIAISTKQLRQNFPNVLAKLKLNKRFLLIHKSIPVAEIQPVENITTFEQATAEDIETASAKDLGDDYLTKKELNYYLSL